MRLVTVPGILELRRGEQIPAIRGTIVEVGKRYAGTNEHGEWSIQNATLQTPEGTIKLKFMNGEPLSVAKGCPVWLRSVDGSTPEIKPELSFAVLVCQVREISGPAYFMFLLRHALRRLLRV